MGLLNDVKSTGSVQPKEAVKEGASTNEKRAKAKARKAAKAAALKEIIEYLQKNPIKALEEAVKTIGTPVERTGGFAPAFTHIDLFGEGAKAGAKITALEVFTKFKKGYPEMRKYIKKWAEKGITVELDPATQSYILK